MSTPTIGRIVHYHVPRDSAPLGGGNHADVAPAVIVAVWSATCVNLKVLTDGPADVWKTSIVEGDQPGQWSWPPHA